MNYLIFIVSLLIFQSSIAQQSTDYLITVNNKKINGQIENINLSLNNAKITLKDNIGNQKTYTPSELIEWSQDDLVFESKPYFINKRKTVIAFMQCLSPVDAPLKVYEYVNRMNKNGPSDLFLERDGNMTQVRFGKFRKQMKEYFADQEAIVQLIKDREIKKKDLLILVEEYNDIITENDFDHQDADNNNIFTKNKKSTKRIWNFNDMLLSTDEAAKKYMEAIRLATKDIVDKKEKSIEINFGVGLSFFEQKQYEAAIPYLKKARVEIQNNQIKLEKAPQLASMLASIYLSQYKYNLAVNYNSNALLAWKETSLLASDLTYIFESHLNQGKILQNLAPSKSNLAWYEMVVPEEEKDWEYQLVIQKLPTIVHATRSEKSIDFNLALLHFKTAEKLIPKLRLSIQAAKKLEIQLALGHLYFEAGEYDVSQTYYEKAQSIIKTNYNNQHPQKVEIKRILSEIYLANELYTEALNYIDQAQYTQIGEEIKIDRSLLDNINKIPFPFELLNSITTKGIILYKKNQANPSEVELKKVLAHYAIATELLYKLRNTHRNEGSNYKLGNITHRLSQHAVIICNTLFNKTQKEEYLHQAFLYAELSKSAVLFETIHNLNSMTVAGIPPHEMVYENGLKVQISYLKGEIFYELQQGEKANQERLKSLQEKVTAISDKHLVLLKKFERNYPEYFNLKYSNKNIPIQDLQKVLAPQEVFLEYVATDSFIYVLAIGPKEIKSHLTRLSHPLSYTVKKLQHALRNNKADLYAIHGTVLYQKTIAGLGDFIKNKKLIIAPDAELNYIPFGVLPTNNPKLKSKGAFIYKQVHFLIEDHPICYNYSASMYLLSKKQKRRAADKTIATWAPNFDAMDKIIKDKGIGEMLTPLPGAQQEAEHIAEMFGSTAYVSSNASELQFKTQAPQYNVLHIATHGVLNDLDPLYSSLILNNQGNEDGILHAFELYNMRLNADLAVLSACNSGMGQLTKGEGVVSIARGFSYAGVPNIIMSKWSVSDWSTEVLMKQFYRNLKTGMPKDEALQQAKIKYLNDNRKKASLLAPFYWGGFILSGNTTPIKTLEEAPSYISYIGIIILILIALFIFVQKAKHP